MFFYAARQPIFDRNKQLYAYELLFRDSLENVFPNVDGDLATSKIIESNFTAGFASFEVVVFASLSFFGNRAESSLNGRLE